VIVVIFAGFNFSCKHKMRLPAGTNQPIGTMYEPIGKDGNE